MKSWEILREAIESIGVKAVAARLGISAALVYKWCQEPSSEDPTSSGARNPLDRLKTIYDVTHDKRLVNWLCNEAGGFYTENPSVHPDHAEERLLSTTQIMVRDFSNLLMDISRSIANDGRIVPDEAVTIRKSWEQLKMQAESFVVACERGLYDAKKK